MPWEETNGELAHRIKDPALFIAESFRRVPLKPSKPRVDSIMGKLKSDGSSGPMTLQALRFPKSDGWTMAGTKTWVKDHLKKTVEPETRRLETKDFEIHEVKEDGTFTGIATVYGQMDLTHDVIDKGALTKTISENPVVPVLFQHQSSEVIGEGTVKEWQNKVLIEGKLDLDDPVAVKVYGKLQKKLIKGLSIGFTTLKRTWEETEDRLIRHIQELKLWEVSIVTFPALPAAQVTRVKSLDEVLPLLEDGQDSFALSAEQVATLEPVEDHSEAGAGEGAKPLASEPVEDHSAVVAGINAYFTSKTGEILS